MFARMVPLYGLPFSRRFTVQTTAEDSSGILVQEIRLGAIVVHQGGPIRPLRAGHTQVGGLMEARPRIFSL